MRAIAATGVGLVAASLAAGIIIGFTPGIAASQAASQFDDERRPGTCVLSEVVQTELSQGQCDALTAIYWATRGPDWDDQRRWYTATDPCSWGGVTCAPGNGHAVVQQVVLHDNGLTGYLPEQVGGLRWLQKLQLSSNDIAGVIPPQVGLLQQLRVLDLSGNRLTGDVPERVGDLTHLRVLNLSDNALSGDVSERLAGLDRLVQLHLERNDCLVVDRAATAFIDATSGTVIDATSGTVDGSVESSGRSVHAVHAVGAVAGRALNRLVESSFHDHCARVDVVSSCLAGNGRVDIFIKNESAAERTYTASVGALASRQRTIAGGAESRISVTGRTDGPHAVVVRHLGVDLAVEQVGIDCDPDLTATAASRCVRSTGRLDVELTNQSLADERMWIAVDDLPLRSALVPAGSSHLVTVGVAAGDRVVVVRTATSEIARSVTRVICT